MVTLRLCDTAATSATTTVSPKNEPWGVITKTVPSAARDRYCTTGSTYGSLIISAVGSRRHARGGNLVRSPRAKEGPAPPEHQPCNGRPQGQPAQVRKHDVKKAGRQPPPVPHGQRAMPKVASLGATTGAKDGDAYPKQQPRQARPTATSRGSSASRDPCRMNSTRAHQDRNVASQTNQTTSFQRHKQAWNGAVPTKTPRPKCLMCVSVPPLPSLH